MVHPMMVEMSLRADLRSAEIWVYPYIWFKLSLKIIIEIIGTIFNEVTVPCQIHS